MSDLAMFNPGCTRCGRPMGEMDEDEFIALILREGHGGLCFDCDPASSVDVPELLHSMELGEFVLFGNTCLVYEEWFRDHALFVVAPHEHARRFMRARGLSSSTYLHRNEPFLVLPKWILAPSGERACFMCEGWMTYWPIFWVFSDGEWKTRGPGWSCSSCDTYLPDDQTMIGNEQNV